VTKAIQCPECSATFTPTKPGRQAFCCVAHKERFHNVMSARGRVVMPLLLARSMGRHTKGDQLGGYCRREADALIARWNIIDRECGRRPDLVARHKLDMGWKGVDLG
jgi:hypothetical protein